MEKERVKKKERGREKESIAEGTPHIYTHTHTPGSLYHGFVVDLSGILKDDGLISSLYFGELWVMRRSNHTLE